MWNGEIKVIHWFKKAYQCLVCRQDCHLETSLAQHLTNTHNRPVKDAIEFSAQCTKSLQEELTKKGIEHLVIDGRVEFKRERTP